MLRYFHRMEERAQELGNHRRKYIHAVERHGRSLIDRLEESGTFDRVHLRSPAADVESEMDTVLQASLNDPEKLSHLGCYYAIQYLLMNIRSVDHLSRTAAATEDRIIAYRDFLHRARDDFNTLIRAYMNRLLGIFLADTPCPEYVVCTVGTRFHQDDVDLGIIDDGSASRVNLNKAIAKMAREMMRWASVPDFYLSEHVGGEGYIVSIDEYRKRLDKRILDFVSVTEILSAERLVGSEALLNRFKREVHNRYYYRKRKVIREHEGYVRGLLGEIESLLLWPHAPQHINPKEDLLRLMSGTLFSFRTMHRIKDSDTWSVLQAMEKILKGRGGPVQALERNYVFVETFRHLYQQFSAQEEEIDLADPNEQECLQKVAHAMGYEDAGVIPAWQQLLVHYGEHVANGRKRIRALVPEIREHIKKITVFAEWVRSADEPVDSPDRPNLAVDFLKRVRYFHGIKYWDDLLEALEDEETGLLKAFIRDLYLLDEMRRQQIVNYYAYWGHETFYTLLRLLSILGGPGSRHEGQEIFDRLNRAFLDSIQGTPDEIRRFSTVFIHFPELVHGYLSLVDEESQRVFHEKVSGDVWDSEVKAWQARLLRFCEILLNSSRFFKRAITRVGEQNPEYLLYFGEPEKLKRITQGILADLMRLDSPEKQKEELGAYYDVQYLRIGLATLQGRPLEQLDREFTEFADHWLQLLFDVCKAEVDARLGTRILTHDLLALFVAGGHGRERAHQDDYDLVVLLNSDDAEIYHYSNQILTRLNREISRRGIMPQHRFADRFGGYVCRFSQLEEFLREAPDEDLYVEMSQLVGARLIVGSGRLEKEFQDRIIHGCIHSQKDTYTRMVIREIYSRHLYVKGKGDYLSFNIKEGRGGLRDLEVGMLLWKVIFEIPEPLGGRFWDVLAEHNASRHQEFLELKESYNFLNRLRDVYRLTIAPMNRLDPMQFDLPARILGYRDSKGVTARQKLVDDFHRHQERVAVRLDALVEEFMPDPE
ncbi:MAG: hypothetical protein JW958_04820 [Candidatus Eisenbacteria bacterium]|nr:hypothetical protein [Candidatus Eisenbacteria bacterium]